MSWSIVRLRNGRREHVEGHRVVRRFRLLAYVANVRDGSKCIDQDSCNVEEFSSKRFVQESVENRIQTR
jgi:hypothetical protein